MTPPEHLQASKYFDLHPDAWDIVDYLDLCELEYGIAISRWLRSLEVIANDPEQTTERQKKAQLLHDSYATDGRKRARDWRKSASGVKGGGLTVYRGPVITAGAGSSVRYSSVGSKRLSSGEGVKRKRVKTIGKISSVVSEPLLVNKPITEPPVELVSDDDNNEEDEVFTDSPCPDEIYVTEAFDQFRDVYKTMEKKTSFSDSTKIFEDVIFQGVTALLLDEPGVLRDNPVLSWVIDLNDDIIKRWFEPEELLQLQNWKLPLPKTDESFSFSLRRFSKAQGVVELRDTIEKTSCRPVGVPYDSLRNFDATYVDVAIEATLSLIDFRERYSKSFLSNLREGWFDSNVWGPLIDRCMQSLDGVLLNRKEIKCDALKLTADKRFDAIFQAPDDEGCPEFGAIEVSRSVEYPPTRKHGTDSAKLVIGLQAMLRRLHQLVDSDEEVIRKQQVVGILNTGFRIQIFRMNCLNTNVFLLDRGKERTVPTAAEHVQAIFGVIQGICCAKYMIQDCVTVTRAYVASKASNIDSAENFQF